MDVFKVAIALLFLLLVNAVGLALIALTSIVSTIVDSLDYISSIHLWLISFIVGGLLTCLVFGVILLIEGVMGVVE